jgi:hypothetical protein
VTVAAGVGTRAASASTECEYEDRGESQTKKTNVFHDPSRQAFVGIRQDG